MATLVNLTGRQYGVELDETSMDIKKFDVDTGPQFKEYQTDKANANIGFVTGPIRQTITLEGELSASSLGVLAFTFTTACTLANDKDYFGVSTGDVFMDSARISQMSDGLKSISINLSRDPGIDLA
jgi:hypothetical protein